MKKHAVKIVLSFVLFCVVLFPQNTTAYSQEELDILHSEKWRNHIGIDCGDPRCEYMNALHSPAPVFDEDGELLTNPSSYQSNLGLTPMTDEEMDAMINWDNWNMAHGSVSE